MTSLLCLRKGREGGLSRVVSSMSVHNAILARNPEYLPPLYEGVPYIHIEEAAKCEAGRSRSSASPTAC